MKIIATKQFDQKALLQQAIATFRHAGMCQNPDFCAGYCDTIAHLFLVHAQKLGLKGKLLAVDNPRKKPTLGYEPWGGKDQCISHYIACFPSLDATVDWTARQFWHNAPVPLIETMGQVKKRWREMPFGNKDSRKQEDNLNYDFDDIDFPEYDEKGNRK